MSTDADTIIKVIGLFGGAGGVGTFLLKRWKPRSMALAGELDQVREDRAEDRARNDVDMAEMRTRIEVCELKAERAEVRAERSDARAQRSDARTRWAFDYAEALRRHISDGNPPPPPPWPEEPVFDVG